jgi:hypothetical protein
MLLLDLPLHPERKSIAATTRLTASVQETATLRMAEPPTMLGEGTNRRRETGHPLSEEHSCCLSSRIARTRLDFQQVIAFPQPEKRA